MSGADRFVSVDGFRLHYVEHGASTAPAIVCFHGGGAHGHAWDLFASLVADRFRVVALTFRGHGDSDRAGDYRYEALNLEAANFIRELGVAPAIICGHSMGAVPAIAIGALWPQLASHLIIVDASIRPDQAGWTRISASMKDRPDSFSTIEGAVEYFRGVIGGMSDDELRRYIEADLITDSDGRYRRKTDPNVGTSGAAITLQEAEEARRTSEAFLSNALRMIPLPTLLIRGTHSDILSADVAAEMVAMLPQGQLAEIEAGHAVFQEQPGTFAEAVLAFVGF